MLLRLGEEEWKAYSAPLLGKHDGPQQTGDEIVDEWEKLLRDGSLKDLEDFDS